MRLKRSAHILKKFQEYVDNESVNTFPKRPLDKAFAYSQKLLTYMRNFLINGYLEIYNNAVERARKPFVISRRN
ncbi:IS66 family transposase [Clostridium beijerinckii]|uniref:IS66 family transposase n=1 Tax=Clostridium beijerinckii TaxID=1520 RepID=UPI00156FE784